MSQILLSGLVFKNTIIIWKEKQLTDIGMNTNKLNSYLTSKYKVPSDFVIINSNIYSKSSLSFQTLSGINDIVPIKAIYYLSTNSKPYKLGYKLGICLM